MTKATTMNLTDKSPPVFPLEWDFREGLEHGGPLNVFDLGNDGLLIRPVKPPGKRVIAKLLMQAPASAYSPSQAASVVNRALRRSRKMKP